MLLPPKSRSQELDSDLIERLIESFLLPAVTMSISSAIFFSSVTFSDQLLTYYSVSVFGGRRFASTDRQQDGVRLARLRHRPGGGLQTGEQLLLRLLHYSR